MPTMTELKQEMTKLALAAQDLVSEKNWVPENKEKLDKIDADIKSVSDQIAEEKHLAEQRKKYAGLADNGIILEPVTQKAGVEQRDAAVAKSIGEQFVESEHFLKGVIERGVIGSGSRWTSGPIELKATVTQTGTGGLTGSGLVQPDYRPTIVSILFQQLTIADLSPNIPVNGPLYRYPKETVATNTAATVAEGGLKPAATINFSVVDELLKKIAETIKVSDEMAMDLPGLRAYLDSRLALFVQIQEEAQLLVGDGAGTNVVGYLNRSGLTPAQAVGADTRVDAIFKEITKIRVTSFLEPTGIVINPTDWQNIRLLKDANGQYYGGGPFTGAYGTGGGMAPDMLWGKTVVPTTAMTLGTAFMGAFATASAVLRRGGLTVDATNSNEDDFLKNLIAIRAEERAGLALFRPSAFGTVTGL